MRRLLMVLILTVTVCTANDQMEEQFERACYALGGMIIEDGYCEIIREEENLTMEVSTNEQRY